jgi:peptidoglycan glycosyltransferase
VGQYNDLVNPCTLMVYMGAIASGGKAAVPQLILQTVTPLDFRVSLYVRHRTGRLVEADTAELLADMMARNVAETYGSGRFPNMDLCAKSGTGEVGGGKAPNAWFAGFLRNEDAPYAFVVLVENGGSGAEAAGGVAAKVLNALVNGD